jgi:sugar phosphate isomerase/epimerase
MTSRRKFLTQAGLAAAGMATLPLSGWAKTLAGASARKATTGGRTGKGVVGLQLYSLRDQLPTDPRAWIPKVKLAGYQDVETFGLSADKKFFGLDTKVFNALLQDNGLVSTSGHYGMDEYLGKGTEHDLGNYIQSVHDLGQTYLTIPYLNEAFRKTADDWKRVAGQFNTLAARLQKENIKLAYHNHNFEFTPVGDTRGLDILIQNTDPALVHFESDLYWVVRGGADPIALFKQYPGRFPMWHIKDMDKAQPNLNTEVGNGSIDFVSIFAQASLAGLEQTFMEQENYAAGMDPYASIAQSAAYILNKLLV